MNAVPVSPPAGPPRRLWPWLAFLSIGIAVAALDLWTKEWAFAVLKVEYVPPAPAGGRRQIAPGFQVIDVIPGCFQLEPSLNYGAFSGWFSSFTSVLALVSFLAVFVLTWILWNHLRQPRPFDWVFVVGLGLVLGGTAGNFYDRCHGAVRDFIKWYVGDLVWPNFNIADSGICVGVGLIVIHLWREGRRQKMQGKAAG